MWTPEGTPVLEIAPRRDAVNLGDIEAAPLRPRVKQLVDIEELVQIALARGATLPWVRDDERELSFDRGLTVCPRRRPKVTWFEAEACAGLSFGTPRPRHPRRDPGTDAARIIAAIRRLDPRAAAMVIACGREKMRPDWKPGIEPRQVERKRSWRKCRRGQKRTHQVWEPCSPAAVQAARNAYSQWRAALVRLSAALDGVLDGYQIAGIGAAAAPWEEKANKAA